MCIRSSGFSNISPEHAGIYWHFTLCKRWSEYSSPEVTEHGVGWWAFLLQEDYFVHLWKAWCIVLYNRTHCVDCQPIHPFLRVVLNKCNHNIIWLVSYCVETLLVSFCCTKVRALSSVWTLIALSRACPASIEVAQNHCNPGESKQMHTSTSDSFCLHITRWWLGNDSH